MRCATAGWQWTGLVILAALSVGFACGSSRARTDGGPIGNEDAHDAGGSTPGGTGGSAAAGTGGFSGGTGGRDIAGTAGAAGGTAISPVDAGSLPSDEWATWPMPNPPSSGLPNPQHYTVSSETVLDEVTGLVWPRKVASRTFLLAEARSYCETLILAGRDDWRLPRAIDLLSLVDYTRVNPALSTSAFPDVLLGRTISSTVLVSFPTGGAALTVTPNTGEATNDVAGAVWCVTGGRPHPTTPHYTVGSGTVGDNWTGLTWQRQIGLYTFNEAQTYCGSLALDGGGWRLPSLNELQSLVDRTRTLSLDISAFPYPSGEQFLTATTAVDISPTEGVWMVIFTQGGWTGHAGRNDTQLARCVR